MELCPWVLCNYTVQCNDHERCSTYTLHWTKLVLYSRNKDPSCYYAVIKEKMDKDLDEISKIAVGLKGNLEALDRAVCWFFLPLNLVEKLSCSLFNCLLHPPTIDATSILFIFALSVPLTQFFFVWQNTANRKIKGCHEGSSTDRTRMAITS